MYFTRDDESENMFDYQATLDTLGIKKDKGTDYVLSQKSRGVYNSELKALYTALFDSIFFFWI